MRVIQVILIYLLLVFIGGALIAPWLYFGVESMASAGIFPSLGEHPFYRFVNRSLLFVALAGLFPFVKALQISLKETGIMSGERKGRRFFAGLAWGAGSLLVVIAFSVLLGSRELDFAHAGGKWMKFIRNTLSAALLVSLIEEIMFRGCLFRALRKEQSFWTAAVGSAMIYALVHFFRKAKDPGVVEWHSGFVVLGQMMHGFVDFGAVFPGFITLTLIGIVLAYAFERSGSLFFSYGLHAGFIICAKSFPFMTNPTGAQQTWLWGKDQIVDGWVTLMVVAALVWAMQQAIPSTTISSPQADSKPA